MVREEADCVDWNKREAAYTCGEIKLVSETQHEHNIDAPVMLASTMAT